MSTKTKALEVPEGILRVAREDARVSRLPQTIWHTTQRLARLRRPFKREP